MTSIGHHFHLLRVQSIRPVADDAIEIRFEPPGGEAAAAFEHQPGQHLTLRQGELRRSYSLCVAPGQGLSVAVRRVPRGVFSNALHDGLRPGDCIDALPPDGRFGAALAREPRHVLLVAAGSGITPIKSIAEVQLARGGQVTLLYANRQLSSAMFAEDLAALKNRHLGRFTLHHLLSREAVDSPLGQGRVDREMLGTVMRLAGPVQQVFVCGPHGFNDTVQADLLALGLPEEAVHVERFGVPPDAAGPAGAATPAAVAGTHLIVVRDGRRREIAWDDAVAGGADNVLSAAIAAGLDLPFSCRSGVCATCRARVLEGAVAMRRNFALDAADLAAGDVLACQAVPTRGRVVISFDER
jgi:ring-1,2-phenylacetyl-CoA epoxidase subunit PaaE